MWYVLRCWNYVLVCVYCLSVFIYNLNYMSYWCTFHVV